MGIPYHTHTHTYTHPQRHEHPSVHTAKTRRVSTLVSHAFVLSYTHHGQSFEVLCHCAFYSVQCIKAYTQHAPSFTQQHLGESLIFHNTFPLMLES